MAKHLHGDPVLRQDGGHVGSAVCPHMVGFMKPGKLRNKKRASLLMLCITVMLAANNTSSRARLRPRRPGSRILEIIDWDFFLFSHHFVFHLVVKWFSFKNAFSSKIHNRLVGKEFLGDW